MLHKQIWLLNDTQRKGVQSSIKTTYHVFDADVAWPSWILTVLELQRHLGDFLLLKLIVLFVDVDLVLCIILVIIVFIDTNIFVVLLIVVLLSLNAHRVRLDFDLIDHKSRSLLYRVIGFMINVVILSAFQVGLWINYGVWFRNEVDWGL